MLPHRETNSPKGANSTRPQRTWQDSHHRLRSRLRLDRIVILLIFSFLFVGPADLGAGGIFAKLKRSKASSRPSISKPKYYPRVQKKRTSRIKSKSVSTKTPTPAIPAGPLEKVAKSDPDQIRIFVLSDSQGQTEFGPEFRKHLLGFGYEVIFHAVKNGTPYFWSGDWKSPVLTRVFDPASTLNPEKASTPWKNQSMRPRSLEEYVSAYDPDIFLIQAGTNFEKDLIDGNAKRMADRIQKCVAQAQERGARILWIGPPDARDDVKSPTLQTSAANALREILGPVSEAQGRDCFFDSRPACPMSNSTRGDGEHPTVGKAIAWADVAAEWVAGSISDMECDRVLRTKSELQFPNPIFTSNLSSSCGTDSTPEFFKTNLHLVAKSNLPDIGTFEYTNAFAVYLYRLGECESSADALGLTRSNHPCPSKSTTEFPAVYVLHWAFHNKGKGSPLTPIHAREVGKDYRMDLVPIEKHPLKDAIATMARFDDFNDFDAPLFVASDVMKESSP